MGRDIKKIYEGLRNYLADGVKVTGIKTLSAGHSNETYLIEGLNRILRLPPSEEGLLPPYDMALQHRVLSAVRRYAPTVPLPEIYELCEDHRVIGDPFFIMSCLQGEAFEYAVPDWLGAAPHDGADRVCRQWFDALIALHKMEPGYMPTHQRTISEEIHHWLAVARGADASQALREVLEDLASRPPHPSGPPTPVHGDPKHGNCLWHNGKLTGLLDWEMAQISEPLLDLGYILMFHDQGDAALANAGFELPGWWSREKMIGEWEAGTGRSATCVQRYEVLGQAKVAAIISLGAHLFASGKTKDARFQAFGAVLPAYTKLLTQRAMKAG